MTDRVLAVCPSTSQGLQDYSHNLYSELSQQVNHFRMVCNKQYSYDADYRPVNIYGEGKLTDIYSTVFHLYDFRPDVVHSQSTNLGLLFVLLLCRMLFNFDLVLTPHSSKSHFERPLYERCQVPIYNLCDGIIWHTKQDKQRMVTAGVDTPQAIISHGNYDFYTDYQTEESQSDVRTRLGIEDDQYVFLFFGYLRQDKRLDLLLKAFSQLSEEELQESTLLIAGKSVDDDLTSMYRDIIEECSIEEHVETHIGFVENEEVPTYFRTADTLVTPYDTISESGVMHIGFAFGLPVIATEVEGFVERFVHKQNGLLIPPTDENALTNALSYTMAHQKEMAQMGEHNRQQAAEEDWDTIAEETINFYKAL